MDELLPFGWTDEFYQKWTKLRTDGLRPGRVIADFGTSLKVALPEIHTAELTGKLAHYTAREGVPKVGDWVAVRLSDNGHAVIESVIPRRSEIARKAAGKQTVKQVVAANVDTAFVVLALDDDFSIKRLERFLYQLSISNVKPIIVLNKADKVKNINDYLDQLRIFQLPVIIATATTGTGVEDMRKCLGVGETAILLGSSGVGKSTLTNTLLGRDAQQTQAVRVSDTTGKHTTVHRELFILPGGGLLIDTPGTRELQLWGTEEHLDENFDDIAWLASQCKFTTCQHGSESGCAIQEALRNGTLDAVHYAHYLKMKSELSGLKAKSEVRMQRSNKRSRRIISDQAKETLREMREDVT